MEFLKEFLIGGSVIAGSKIVATYAGPALAPIVGGMPTGIIAAYFLASKADKFKYYAGYFYTSFLLFLAITGIHFTSKYLDKTSIDLISTIYIIIWAFSSYFLVAGLKSAGVISS
jgi:hypothetical protein